MNINEIKASDFILAYKIIKDLGIGWTEYDAYKLGLIDDSGKKLKNAESPEEKDAVTSYTKIIFNLKRLLQKVVGKSSLAQRIVSTFLLKESYNKNVIHVITENYKLNEFSFGGAVINEDDSIKYIESFLEAHIIKY